MSSTAWFLHVSTLFHNAACPRMLLDIEYPSTLSPIYFNLVSNVLYDISRAVSLLHLFSLILAQLLYFLPEPPKNDTNSARILYRIKNTSFHHACFDTQFHNLPILSNLTQLPAKNILQSKGAMTNKLSKSSTSGQTSPQPPTNPSSKTKKTHLPPPPHQTHHHYPKKRTPDHQQQPHKKPPSQNNSKRHTASNTFLTQPLYNPQVRQLLVSGDDLAHKSRAEQKCRE